MDVADIAARNDAFFLTAALRNRAAAMESANDDDECVDCGCEIPQARIAACRAAGIGCCRCIACQAEFEEL